MFMGPLEEMKPWSTRGVEGVYRFLNRVWRLYRDDEGHLDPRLSAAPASADAERVYHATVKKVGEDIEGLHFNTAIAQLMIFVNEITKTEERPRALLEPFVLLLAPFAPHIAEELWAALGHTGSLVCEPWPVYDPAKIVSDSVEVVLQVNGKVRGKITMPVNAAESELQKAAMADQNVRRHAEGKQVVKMIVVQNKLVNVVVR
jgi:leucyl-tRNA synthetase